MSTGKLFWGFVLLIVGSFFLADNLGYLPFNPGLLWPLLIILLGIFVILGARFSAGDGEIQSIDLDLDGTKRARVKLEHGAGRVRLSGAAPAGKLIQGEFRHLDLRSQRSGDTANLSLKSNIGEQFLFMFPWNWGGTRHAWDFALNADIPLSIEVESGASELTLDLRQLKIESLELETGASSSKVFLPEAAGFTQAAISAGAASVDITVPEGVAADIRVESGLGSVSVDQTRFPRNGKRYTSPDYAAAVNKVEINVETGVSSTTIR